MSAALLQEVTTRDQFAAVIAHLSRSQYAYKVPLYRAAQAGMISLCEITRGATPPLKRLDRTDRPSIVLVGDDDYASTGPAGWVATRRLMYWIRAALVHGTGGTMEDYCGAVAMALKWDKVVLVETSSEHLVNWADVVQKAPHRITAVFKRPTAPGVHPIPLTKGDVQ
jgi:hypothetical protein